jgi:O-antigen/teichoic acid export membrane protein
MSQEEIGTEVESADATVEVDAPPPPTPDILDTAEAGPRAVRGSVFRSAGYALSLGLSLISVPFMIRHLGAVDYGYFITVSSIVFIIGGVTEAGLTYVGIAEVSKLEGEEREGYLRNLVGLRFALTIPGIAIAVGLTAVTGAEAPIVYGTAIAGLGLILALTQQTYMIPLTAELRLGWVAILEFLKQATLSACFIVFVLLSGPLIDFFWASVIAGAVMIVATLLLVRRHASLRPGFEIAAWKSVLRETLPYAVATAVGLVYFRIVVVLMSYLATGEETGIFSAAFRITEVVVAMAWVVVSSAFPILARAARDDEERLAYGLQRVFEVSLIIGTGMAIGLAVGAPFAIHVVAGPGFNASIPVLRIQALALITSFLLATWALSLLALKRYREVLLANLLAAVVSIGGTVALVPSLGAKGGAIAIVAAEAALVAACVYFMHRAHPALTPSPAVIPKVLAAAAAAVGISLLLGALPSVALSVLAMLVFAGVILATRALPAEAVEAFSSWRTGRRA